MSDEDKRPSETPAPASEDRGKTEKDDGPASRGSRESGRESGPSPDDEERPRRRAQGRGRPRRRSRSRDGEEDGRSKGEGRRGKGRGPEAAGSGRGGRGDEKDRSRSRRGRRSGRPSAGKGDDRPGSPDPVPPYPEGVVCQSCGRFVGAYERCPHCQAKVSKTVSLRLIKRIVVIGAVLGLAAMYVASRIKDVPLLRVEEIRMENNMALVEVEGRIQGMSVNKEKNTFFFDLNDGTGRMRIAAFNRLRQFRKVLGEDFPDVGDRVRARGNLNITEKFGKSMFLSNPYRLRVIERMPVMKIGRISSATVGQTVKLIASVGETPFQTGAVHVTPLTDGSGTMAMTLFDNEFKEIPSHAVRSALQRPGTRLALKVLVAEYKGRLQLRPVNIADPSSIEILRPERR